MKGMKRIFRGLFPLALCVLCAACAPTERVHGNIVETAQLEQIKRGQSTKSDVLRVFGSPVTVAPFDESVWYYIGQKTEKRGILDPKVTDGQVVVVSFDPSGTVRDLRVARGTPQDIPSVDRATPVTGTQSSPIQDFFGNIGKYNSRKPE
mgnify:CR=1 FL=1